MIHCYLFTTLYSRVVCLALIARIHKCAVTRTEGDDDARDKRKLFLKVLLFGWGADHFFLLLAHAFSSPSSVPIYSIIQYKYFKEMRRKKKATRVRSARLSNQPP